MQGRGPHDRTRRRLLRRTAILVGALGVALLTASHLLIAEPDVGYRIAADLARLVGAVAVVAGLLVAAYEVWLHPWWVDELAALSGPALLDAMLPAQVQSAVLRKVYGDSPANHDVVHGVLGGEGIQPDGSDLSISTSTSVHLELRSEVPGTYEQISTVGYTFRAGLGDTRLIIFATCDPRLRDMIAAACDRPMFDWWYVADQDIFAESVAGMLSSVEVGVRYRSAPDDLHDIPLTKIEPRYVPFDEWHHHLTFFRESMGPVPKQDPNHYIATLAIYECDLTDVEYPDHPIERVEGLTSRIATLGSTDDGFCYWQPPYPCFVDEIAFDVAGLGSDDGTQYQFRIVPFVLRAGSVPTSWTGAGILPAVRVRSWLLPGHGVMLMWRPRSPHTETGEIDDH